LLVSRNLGNLRARRVRSDDPTQAGGPAYAFATAPENPLNRYVTVASGHLGAPDAAGEALLAWLDDLSK
jgi:hypothetical protein